MHMKPGKCRPKGQPSNKRNKPAKKLPKAKSRMKRKYK